MFTRSRTIATVRGIPIRIDASLVVIAALIGWSFWASFASGYGVDGLPAALMAAVAVFGFLGSILLHELGHSLEAQHRGVRVRSITLFVFGGVTESDFDVRGPRDELALVAAGPLTSFLLAGLFWAVAWTGDAAGAASVGLVAGLLGWLNLALGVFNLLPGAPLDGGRILRAIVWWATGDRQRASLVATTAGRVVGAGLVGLGVAEAMFLPGGFIGGLWMGLIGWFLLRAAAAEAAQVHLEQLLGGMQVGSLLPGPLAGPAPTVTVAEAVAAFPFAFLDDAVPVVDAGALVGVVEVDRLRALPVDQRSSVLVGQLAVPVAELPAIEAGDTAVHLLATGVPRPVVVTDGGRPVGVVTPKRVRATLERLEALAPH